MKSLPVWEAVLGSVMGIAFMTGVSHAQESIQIHPALSSEMISVVVKEIVSVRHHGDRDVTIASASGFSAGDCDIVTTFGVVAEYERRQTWSEVRQKIEIIVGGIPHEGLLRPIGVSPGNFGLACIDFASAADRSVIHSLSFAANLPSPIYAEGTLSRVRPGSPLINEDGKVVAMLATDERGFPQLIGAPDIRRFLKMAERIPHPN
jgi:hypothetical protein